VANTNSTRDFYVYVHRRSTDGSVFYVGKGNGRRAWAKQGRSKYWNNIVTKNGYTVEIVQSGMLEWWAFELEIELIAFYGRDNLCNLSDGGEGATGVKRSAENIARQIALHLGSKRSAESCKRMSDAQKSSLNRIDISGDKNPAKLEDVRAKMRGPRPSMCGINNSMNIEGVKMKFIGAKNPSARSVLCIETGEVFETLKKAAEWASNKYGLKPIHTAISMCCSGRYKTALKHTWKYT